MAEENSTVVVDDIVSTSVTNLSYAYENNDVCLTIYPYDNYKKIALYEYINESNIEYSIDRSDYYKYYLEFGDVLTSKNKKIISISEYKDYTSSNGGNIKLASNELLFKITQKEAYEILSLSSNVFNVVRELIIEDGLGNTSVSERQSVFFGRWATPQEKLTTNNSKVLNEMETKIKDLLETNDELNMRIIELLKENAELTARVEELSGYVEYEEKYNELANKLDLQDVNTYTAEEIDSNAKYITVNIDDKELENQVNDYLERLQDTTQI